MRRALAAFALVAAGVLAFPRPVPAQERPAVESVAIGHPAEDYRRAAELLKAGARDAAVYWFYRGQLRARIHLAARPSLPKSGDPALFASLNEVVGRPVNEWAFGDMPALAATLDKVLAWHAANDDPFTPKADFGAAHAQVTAVLAAMKTTILAQREQIKAQRSANGLANRN